MLLPAIIEPSEDPIITLEEAKKHLDVYGFNDDDEQIVGLINAAVDFVERSLNITLGKTKIKQDYCDFYQASRLHSYPVLSIEQITYLDCNNQIQVLKSDHYNLLHTVGNPTIQFLKPLPNTYIRQDAVSVILYAGYTKAIPNALKAAILMKTASLYEARDGITASKTIDNRAFEELIWVYRRPKV